MHCIFLTHTHIHTNLTVKGLLLIIRLFQERYSSMTGLDGKTQLQMLAFKSPKIRLLRSMTIENETMQVLFTAVSLLNMKFNKV